MMCRACPRLTAFIRKVRSLGRDTNGGAMMLVGVSMTALLGFAGLGVDVANLYSERRSTQSMADAAAISGTYADISSGSDLTAIQQAAINEAMRNGYTSTAGNLIQVSAVPHSGTPMPIRPRVEVVVQRQINLVFLRMFMDATEQAVAARAVGGWRSLGPMCVISLEETEDGAITFQGSTTANVSCGVSSNSSSGSAINISGSATLIANPAQAYGDIAITGAGELISNYPPLPHSPRVVDPYADQIFPPAPATCDLAGLVVAPNTTVTIDAGGGSIQFCGDVDIRGTLNLGSGTYYLNNGNLLVNAASAVNGTDVTIVMTGGSPSDVGSVTINGGSSTDLSAPSAGPYAGIVFYIDPIAERQIARFNGGADMSLLGVVYAPSQDLEYSGGTGTGGCTQLIARTVTFTGDSYIENTPALCQTVGLNLGSDDESAQRQIVLVE